MVEEIARYETNSEAATVEAGESFARDVLGRPVVVALRGELGAGKTHFVKGIAAFFGIDARELTSPTYALVNEFECVSHADQVQRLYHLDCYRFERADELRELGVEEYLAPQRAVTVIEWPERIEQLLPAARIEICIEVTSATHREILVRRVA